MKDDNLLMPRYRFRSILDITPNDIRNMGAEGIGVDIDNVITPDGTFRYIDGINEWIEGIRKAGIPLMIISNGNFLRVRAVAKHVGNVPFIHLSRKPSPVSLIKAAKRMNIDVSKLAMLGDQLFSDIKAANRCGAIPVRIDPIEAKSLYPHYYKWKAKREAPYIKKFEALHGYGVYDNSNGGNK